MSTDNLEKGYWQVKLSERHRDYFGVSIDGRYYVANVLILGSVMQFLHLRNLFVQLLDTLDPVA